MIRALYTAASGMSAQQTNLDTIANNLANSATAGFSQRQVQFEDMIYQNLITPGSPQTQQTLSAGLQVGLGTKIGGQRSHYDTGGLQPNRQPVRSRDSGRRILSDLSARRNYRLYASRKLPLEQSGHTVTSDGDTVLPAITIPSNATTL